MTLDQTKLDLPLDEGIRRFVEILDSGGIETYESCEGGPGHPFAEPTIRFHGQPGEGFRAYAVAADHALPVAAVRRSWQVVDHELSGPTWEITFWRKDRTE